MEKGDPPLRKIVARFRDGRMIKGYIEPLSNADVEAIMGGAPTPLPSEITLRTCSSGERLSISLDSLKALFFVKSFDGRREHHELKFFERMPAVRGIWVRVTFQDRETLEGVVHNSLHFLVSSGFFLKPPDPNSNNEVLYVVKDSLQDFQVLGVRTEY
jgi:Family of unknown function (DUF6982)